MMKRRLWHALRAIDIGRRDGKQQLKCYLIKETNDPDPVQKTKGKLILPEVEKAESFIKRSAGLIFRSEPTSGYGMLFEECGSIHTLFMKFPIDAVLMDNENRVVRVISGLRPYRFTPFIFNANKVLELKNGSANFLNIKAGDWLKFIH